MGRKRTGGAEPLPQAVRRNNAKNERKTMEAMAENLWTSVESGKERRLRLAAERLYGLTERTPHQQQHTAEASSAPNPKTDKTSTEQKEATAPVAPNEKADKAPTREKAAKAPAKAGKKTGKAPSQEKEAETPVGSNKTAGKDPIQEKTAEVAATPDKQDDQVSTQQQREAKALVTPDEKADKSPIHEKASKAQAKSDSETGKAPSQEEAAQTPVRSNKAAGKDLIQEKAAEVTATPNKQDDQVSTQQLTGEAPRPAKTDVDAASTQPTMAEAQPTSSMETDGMAILRRAAETLATSIVEPDNSLTQETVADDSAAPDKEGVAIVIRQETPEAPTTIEPATEPATEVGDVEEPALLEEVTPTEAAIPTGGAEIPDQNGVCMSGWEVVTTPMQYDKTVEAGGSLTMTQKSVEDQESSQENVENLLREDVTGASANANELRGVNVSAALSNEQNIGSLSMTEQHYYAEEAVKDAADAIVCEADEKLLMSEESGAAPVPEAAETGVSGKEADLPTVSQSDVITEQASSTMAPSTDERTESATAEEQDANVTDSKNDPKKKKRKKKGRHADEPSTPLVAATRELENVTSPHFEQSQQAKVGKKQKRHKDKRKESQSESEKGITVEDKNEDNAPVTTDVTSEASMCPSTDTNTITTNGSTQGAGGTEMAAEPEDEAWTTVETKKTKRRRKRSERKSESEGRSQTDVHRENETEAKTKSIVTSETTTELTGVTETNSPNGTFADGTSKPTGTTLSEETVEEPKDAVSNLQQQINQSQETKPASDVRENVPKTTGEAFQEPVAGPDAFDLLMSAGEDLEEGFKDAFGEEDQGGCKPEEAEDQAQISWNSSKTVEVKDECHTPVEPQETLRSEPDSTTKEDVKQDAFDILLSAGDDLQEGFKDSFDSEEQVPKEPEQQQHGNETTKAKPSPALHQREEDVVTPESECIPETAEEMVKEADAAPDAFDLLMSAGEDLEEGFKDAFGEEDQGGYKPEEAEDQAQISWNSSKTVENKDECRTPVESQETLRPGHDSTTKEDVKQDAFDILLSVGDDLQEGFKDSFGSEEQIPKESEHQQQGSETTKTKHSPALHQLAEDVATSEPEGIPSTAEEMVKEADAAPDAFDLLMSTGEDLDEGFKDAFGAEDQDENKPKQAEKQLQEIWTSDNTVGIKDEGYAPVESPKPSTAEANSIKNEKAKQDAFDLLLSEGNDLQEGFKDSFGSEEEVPKEQEQQRHGNETPRAKLSPVLHMPMEDVTPGPDGIPRTTDEVVKKADDAPDAFDLLMSTSDDLEVGFKDAFGAEDQGEDMSKEAEEQVQAICASTKTVGLKDEAGSVEGNVLVEASKTSTAEADATKTENVQQDAFDHLLSKSDDLGEGFKNSFGEEQVPKEAEQQMRSSELTEANPVSVLQKPVEDIPLPEPEKVPTAGEMDEKAGAATDVLDLLTSEGDDLEAGFKDAFAEEDQGGDKLDEAEKQVQVTCVLNEAVEAKDEYAEDNAPVESQETPRAKPDSNQKEDAFDLLLSATDDLEKGFKDSFGSEEQGLREPEEQRETSELTEVKSASVLHEPVEDIPPPESEKAHATEEIDEKAGAAPDAFDLLISGGDDLEAGFKDAFDEEDQGGGHELIETEKHVQVTCVSNEVVEVKDEYAKDNPPIETQEIPRAKPHSNQKEDAFDLLQSATDDLEEGFKDSFGSEEQGLKEPEEQSETSELTEAKSASVLQKPVEETPRPESEKAFVTEEIDEKADAAPDAFDILPSAGDDLEAGFKDAFGEEDQGGDKLNDAEKQMQVTCVSNEPVEAKDEYTGNNAPAESQEISRAKPDSNQKQDAFDLLLSATDDLEEGFRDSFGSEEQGPKEPEEQRQTSDLTEAEPASVLHGSAKDVLLPEPGNASNSTEELSKQKDAAPDAFDLLLSTGDDLEVGFNDAFGEEGHSEDKTDQSENKVEANEAKRLAQADSSTVVGSTATSTDNSLLQTEETSKTEENGSKEADRTPDAFDILMSAGDDLQEGFKESFSLEEASVVEAKTESINEDKSKNKLESKENEIPEAKIDEDEGTTLLHDTAGTDLQETATVAAGSVDQAHDEIFSGEHASSETEVRVVPDTIPEWFDKNIYDNAEAKYHEQLSLDQDRGNADKEECVVTEVASVESIVQEPESKFSEAKAADATEIPHQAVAPREGDWYDKMMHDDAEIRYYERLSRSQVSEPCVEDSLPSATNVTSSSPPSVTSKDDDFMLTPVTGENVESQGKEKSTPESYATSTDPSVDSAWYDKVMHDEAESRHYERLSRSKYIEPSDKKSLESSPKRTKGDSAPMVLSSEQTWFDKPFHDSVETVHHERQASNESDSSNKSFPLYEGRCDHFKPEDQQTPEESVGPNSEVESYDSWTESKLYKVTGDSRKPEKPAQEAAVAVPAKDTTRVAASSPEEETDAGDASSDNMPTQHTVTATQITVKTEDSPVRAGEPPHSPTSDDSRSRQGTFNSAVSPVSPVSSQVEPDEVYFEDVVLAGRQSDVTMAALRGFTASPLSESLAPGEQLDSLRTEPDLELSEPGTADTLDDGPFPYEDVGDEGAATPVGDASASTAVQSLEMKVTVTSETSENESKDDALSSTSDDLVKEVNLDVSIPLPELRRNVPSPSLDGGVTKFEMETSITAPAMPTQLPPTSLRTDIPEPVTTTDVGAIDLQIKDIPIPNIDIEIPSVQLTPELAPESQISDTVKSEEPISLIMASTPAQNDVQRPPISEISEDDPNRAANGIPTSSEKVTIDEVICREAPTNGMKESPTVGSESTTKEINEKLGLNEDGTVPLREPDEEVLKFTEQGAPRSPVATKRCSRKKKMRSGGRKSSSESIEDQPKHDTFTTSIQDESGTRETEVLVKEMPTKEESPTPLSETTAEAQPTTVVEATPETKLNTEDNVAAEDSTTDTVREDKSVTPQPDSQLGTVDPHPLPMDSTISVQSKDTVSPSMAYPSSTDTKSIDRPHTPATPESQPKMDDAEAEDKSEATEVVESQPKPATNETEDKPHVPVSTTQLEIKPAGKETKATSETPASPVEPQPTQTETETLSKVEPEDVTVPSKSSSKLDEGPEVIASSSKLPEKPADKSEIPASTQKPQEPEQKKADEPEASTSPPQPKSKPEDKSDVQAIPTKSQPKPVDKRPSGTSQSVTSTVPNEAKPADQKPTTRTPAASRPILPDRTLFLPGDEGRTYASLMQQGADMLPARPVFTAHACHVCKRLHTKQHRLKSCGSCRLVAYCSAEHQRAHWPLHRALCKVITRRVRHLGTDHLYREALNVSSAEQWKKIRFKHMAVCEEMLGRPMEAYEKEMFLYPRACDTCHETNPEKLHTCANCHSVSFCSEEHLRKNHSKYCKDLRTLLDIHSYQNSHGVCEPPLPETVLDEYEILPPHIRELLVVGLLGPHRAMALGPVPLAVLTDYASYPLTLLYALQNIPTPPEAHISQLSELTVHVVGAEHATDCHPLSRWGSFLLHLLPRLRRLRVVFIGLELEAAGGRPGVTQRDFTSETCRAAGRQLTCELQPSTAYHTYCRSPQFRPPHVIAAFNAGLHRFAGHERRDTWRETIPYLVRDGVPLILSGYTLLECPQDVARIQQEQKVDVLLPPMKNPYRSTRPQQNFLNEHEAPVVFKNQYVACLTAAAKARK